MYLSFQKSQDCIISYAEILFPILGFKSLINILPSGAMSLNFFWIYSIYWGKGQILNVLWQTKAACNVN